MSRKTIAMMVMAGVLLTVVMAFSQEGKPSGTLTLESKSVAVGVGVSWGDGTLTFEGQKHSFSVGGLSVVDVGVSKVSASGEVFNLKKLEDFSGNYVAAQAGGAVAGGGGVVTMRNQNGVVIKLAATGTGIKLALGPKGVDVKLKS
jgi:hypothetical protein